MVVIVPVILSGGAGTRLWPLSRAEQPKQLLRVLGGPLTLLQETARRVAPPQGAAEGLRFAPLLVIGNAAHGGEILSQIAETAALVEGLLLEPSGRNTAAAAAVAALYLEERGRESLMLLMPADHFVGNLPAFHAALARAAPEAERGRIVTLGIAPTRPETGYGYIQRGRESPQAAGAFEVERFIEKPDPKAAAAYAASDKFSWNAGVFLAKPAVIVSELQRHAPAVLEACRAAMAGASRAGLTLTLGSAFERAPAIAFDRAVMEKTALASVVPVAMDWCDVGSWEAVWELSPKDGDNNVREGLTFVDDCRNSLVRAEGRLVAIIGVDDLVVIESKDAVLVMPRAKAQRLADLVPALEAMRPRARKQD